MNIARNFTSELGKYIVIYNMSTLASSLDFTLYDLTIPPKI